MIRNFHVALYTNFIETGPNEAEYVNSLREEDDDMTIHVDLV